MGWNYSPNPYKVKIHNSSALGSFLSVQEIVNIQTKYDIMAEKHIVKL